MSIYIDIQIYNEGKKDFPNKLLGFDNVPGNSNSKSIPEVVELLVL